MTGETPTEAMTEAQAVSEWADLVHQVLDANRAYHRDDAPVLSDAAYDAMKRRLAALEAAFPGVERAMTMKSPTAMVGGPSGCCTGALGICQFPFWEAYFGSPRRPGAGSPRPRRHPTQQSCRPQRTPLR